MNSLVIYYYKLVNRGRGSNNIVLCKTLNLRASTGKKIYGVALRGRNRIDSKNVVTRVGRRLKISRKIARIELKNLLAFFVFRRSILSSRKGIAENSDFYKILLDRSRNVAI